MTPRFDGLTALVTGATSGIGEGIAGALEAAGARVHRHGVSGGGADVLRADLGEPGAARELARDALARGPVDILVLSASVQLRRAWSELTTEEFERQLRVDLVASFELIQELAGPMLERGWGRILAIGSVQQHRPHPQMLAYSAAKSAQLNLVRSLAAQYAARGVTVNNLAPGVIETPRNTEALADETYRARVLAGIPASRVGDVAECVAPALLLCSRGGGYITGQDLVVDGGMSL